jgi:hypothetical protein
MDISGQKLTNWPQLDTNVHNWTQVDQLAAIVHKWTQLDTSVVDTSGHEGTQVDASGR